MSEMRARGWCRQGGIMGVTLCVRPGDGGTIVAVAEMSTSARRPRCGRPCCGSSARWREATHARLHPRFGRACRGLLTSDVSLLQHASAQLPDLWARACAVEDQGVLLAAAGRDREAIRSWASLTDIEQATARLVAEGLTNQRIADQLFISTHTVAFHLRQVFCRLGIRSRVDLARIALEHARPETAQTP